MNEEEQLLVMNENKVNESENWLYYGLASKPQNSLLPNSVLGKNCYSHYVGKVHTIHSSNNLLGMVGFIILKNSFCTSNTLQWEDIERFFMFYIQKIEIARF